MIGLRLSQHPAGCDIFCFISETRLLSVMPLIGVLRFVGLTPRWSQQAPRLEFADEFMKFESQDCRRGRVSGACGSALDR
jgi:hypothetical protein